MPTDEKLKEDKTRLQKYALSALLFKLLFKIYEIYEIYDIDITETDGTIEANCPDRPRTKNRSSKMKYKTLYQIFATYQSTTDTTRYTFKIQTGHSMVELPKDTVVNIAEIDCLKNLYNLRSTSNKKVIEEVKEWSQTLQSALIELERHGVKLNLEKCEAWTQSQIAGLLYLTKIAQAYHS